MAMVDFLTRPELRRAFRRRLLDWYRRHHRKLPWRATRDPYAIWVSEVMLQQTQVKTVIPYFDRFLRRFPSVESLAAADASDVLAHWEGLGYYRRARQLHQAAQAIAIRFPDGFPSSVADFLELPGIGRYTANAVYSQAFDARLPILEANTYRLWARLMALECDVRSAEGQRVLWTAAEQVLGRTRCGELNQALMELGSQVCQPTPHCDACPVSQYCQAFRTETVDRVPVAGRRMEYERISELAIVIRAGDHVWLRRCGAEERWAGLWDFPRQRLLDERRSTILASEKWLAQTYRLSVRLERELLRIKHQVTRYRIDLHCWLAHLCDPRQVDRGHGPDGTDDPPPANSGSDGTADQRWVRVSELPDFPQNVTARQISHMLAQPGVTAMKGPPARSSGRCR